MAIYCDSNNVIDLQPTCLILRCFLLKKMLCLCDAAYRDIMHAVLLITPFNAGGVSLCH